GDARPGRRRTYGLDARGRRVAGRSVGHADRRREPDVGRSGRTRSRLARRSGAADCRASRARPLVGPASQRAAACADRGRRHARRPVGNGKKKRKRPSGSTSTYRAPAQADQPRRGLLDGLLAPRTPGASPMPKLRTTIAKGTMTALGIPGLLVAIPVVLLVVLLLLTLAGFQGPITLLGVTFAIPPITTFADQQVAGRTFRAAVDATGLSATLPGFGGLACLLLLHAAVSAVTATLCVEKLRTGS